METKPIEIPQDSDERDVGITEFLSEGKQILSRFKYRFTDFLVNEITSDGQVVKPPPKRDPNAKLQEEKKPEPEPESLELKPEAEAALRKVLSPDDFVKLLKFLEEVNLSNYGKGLKVEMDSPEGKEARKQFHEAVRSLGSKLDSDTFDVSGRKMIRIYVVDSKNKKRRFDRREFPEKYLEFTLHKTNFDSMGAIGLLSKFLNMKPNNFGIAGNKDKRGITTQRVTVFRSLAEDFEKLQNRKKWNDNIVMGDYAYTPRQFKLGDLKGNRFALGLRLVENNEEQSIENNVKGLIERGFINYYGLQRFGVTNIKTHVVGKEVLKKNWKGVIELILSANDADYRADEVKKNFLQNWDCKEALKKLPNRNKIDRTLIEGLKHAGINNFRGAFMNLPRFLREIYGHAYQSYIWNKTVSQRLAKYGKEPIAGDMVILGDNVDIEEDVTENEGAPVEDEGEDKKEGEKIEEEKSEEVTKREKFDPSKVIILTEETKGNYTLHDIVVPLVGRDIPLTENNPISEIINEILKEDGLSLKDFIKSDQDVFFRGGFRKLAIKPDDIKWDLVKYNDSEQDIQNPYYFTEKECESDPNGQFQAIRIKFNLMKSAYATMCLRELTKSSTSFNFQMKLNNMTSNTAVVDNKPASASAEAQ